MNKYYEINYKLKTAQTFIVEAKSKKEAREVALEKLDEMSKQELMERFLAALDFNPVFSITGCKEVEY